jgi:hypothetical protein
MIDQKQKQKEKERKYFDRGAKTPYLAERVSTRISSPTYRLAMARIGTP